MYFKNQQTLNYLQPSSILKYCWFPEYESCLYQYLPITYTDDLLDSWSNKSCFFKANKVKHLRSLPLDRWFHLKANLAVPLGQQHCPTCCVQGWRRSQGRCESRKASGGNHEENRKAAKRRRRSEEEIQQIRPWRKSLQQIHRYLQNQPVGSQGRQFHFGWLNLSLVTKIVPLHDI